MKRALLNLFIVATMLFGYAQMGQAQGINYAASDTESDKVKLGQNYPNPAVGKTFIEIDFEGLEAQLSIYNVVGKLIEVRIVTTKLIVIDVSQYNEGLYLYTLEANGEKITKRMTVRKQ